MRVYIAADHAGYDYKEVLKGFLKVKKYEVVDVGNHKLDAHDDYPDFVIPLAKKVAKDKASFGIIIGNSGNGEQIAANKVKGVRASLCLNPHMAALAREHNDANILAMGSEFMHLGEVKLTTAAFLETHYTNEDRHNRRIAKISSYELTKHESSKH